MRRLPHLSREAGYRPKRSEASVLSSCLKLLKARGIFALRLNVGGAKYGSQWVKFGLKGMADILAIEDWGEEGFMPTWIECKSDTGKQSPAQKEFQAIVESEGHSYFIVHSAEELNRIL